MDYARRYSLSNVTQILSRGKHTSIIKLNEKSWYKSLGGHGLLLISKICMEWEMGTGDAGGLGQVSACFAVRLHLSWSILYFHASYFLLKRCVLTIERPDLQVCRKLALPSRSYGTCGYPLCSRWATLCFYGWKSLNISGESPLGI